MVNNHALLRECVNKLALKRRSSDGETSREGLNELNIIKADQLQEMIAIATAAGAASAQYYSETAKDLNNANTGTETGLDGDGAAINTNAFVISMINNLNDLYVEQLKYLAISNIENIEMSALEAVASMEELGAKPADEADAGIAGGDAAEAPVAEVVNTSATVVETSAAGEWVWEGDGVCKYCEQRENGEAECREAECPDGQYVDPRDSHVVYRCEKGVCEKVDI